MTDEIVPAPPRSGPSPFFLGLVGLALALGGWKLSSWTPPRSGAGEGLFAEVRGLADDQLGERMDSIRRGASLRPPLELPGRLAFFTGVIVFAAALVRMWQSPAPSEETEPVS